jgi:hypothetical protein
MAPEKAQGMEAFAWRTPFSVHDHPYATAPDRMRDRFAIAPIWSILPPDAAFGGGP